MPIKWPWSKPEEQDVSDRFDDVLDDDEETGGEGAGEEEEAPELDEVQQAYLEREAVRREEAVLAKVRTSLQQQGLDYTGDGAAIRDVNTFAAKFGFAGQQQQQQAAPPPPPEPPAELPEMPDPSYDQAGFAAWLAKRDEINQAKLVRAFEAQFERLEQRQKVSTVDTAVARARAVAEEEGNDWGAIEGYDAALRETLLKLDPTAWTDDGMLFAAAASVKRSLKAGPVAPRREAPRGEDGRFLAAEQRRSLPQVASPRDSGRPAPGEAPADEIEREQARVAGMTLREWRAYGPDTDYQAHRQFQEREAARNRGRR